MVENLRASRFQHFNELAGHQETMGRTWNGVPQQPYEGTGALRGGFNHNMTGFLTEMAVESEKTGLC